MATSSQRSEASHRKQSPRKEKFFAAVSVNIRGILRGIGIEIFLDEYSHISPRKGEIFGQISLHQSQSIRSIVRSIAISKKGEFSRVFVWTQIPRSGLHHHPRPVPRLPRRRGHLHLQVSTRSSQQQQQQFPRGQQPPRSQLQQQQQQTFSNQESRAERVPKDDFTVADHVSGTPIPVLSYKCSLYQPTQVVYFIPFMIKSTRVIF